MIKSVTQSTNTKKCKIHYPSERTFNLFNKRVVICDVRHFKPSYLLNNKDVFKVILKNSDIPSCLNMRLVNKKSRKLATSELHLLLTKPTPLSISELCDSKNEKRNFILANKLKIETKLSTDDDVENLITFINEANNHADTQLLLNKIEVINCQNEIIDDNIQAIQTLLDLLALMPSLAYLSLSKIWAPITFKPLPLKHLYIGFLNAALEFEGLNNLATLHFKTIMAPIIFPEKLPSLKSLTYEEVIDEAATEQLIKTIQKSIADKSESISQL